MFVLRKLTGCLSSTTCDNDETPQQEENTDSTITVLSQLSVIQSIEKEKAIANKVDWNIGCRHSEKTSMITEE
jgi:hypothetical protein